MFKRTVAIARKESRELMRDPVYLGLAFIVPILLLLLFGYGLSLDVKHLPLVFVDRDQSPVSREYRDAFTHSEYFDLVGVVSDPNRSEHLLRTGRARVIINIPPDFSRRLVANKPVAVGVTIDGSFPTRAEIIIAYVAAINRLYNQRLLATFLQRQPSRPGLDLPIRLSASVWYNPALESKNFIVPGMMVIIMMFFPAILGALLIVREKEAGTIFNFYASPVRKWEILAGKAIPYIAVAFLTYLILFAMSISLFETRFIGSFWVLSVGTLLYTICTIGIGLLISVVTRTQLAAMLLTFMLTVTPAFNFSGFLAPVASQDAVGQFVAQLLPATYFMKVVRGTYLKGLGFEFYGPDLAALTVYAILIYLATWLLLKKRIA